MQSRGNTIALTFLPSIWYYYQSKDGANTTTIWTSQRNCFCYYGAFQKHKKQWFTHQMVASTYCCWSLERRYISTIYVYNLPRLGTTIISISNRIKWFHIKKTKSRWYPSETMTNADPANYQIHLPKTNPCCIAWSKQQVALASART